MNHVERFRAVMAFQAVDRLPRWEWAMWWDQTIDRWHAEGLPRELRFSQVFDIARYFGLDPYQQFWFSTTDATIEATQHHVEGMVSNMDDYLRIRPQLFPDHDSAIRGMSSWAARQERGEAVVWSTLEGFFWFPRTLMGFEKMMYAYVDEPELLHQINQDLLEFNLRLLDRILPVCVPTFMTIAEDMSYNHGPMISKRTFDEFVAPYYRQLLPRLQERQIPLIMDTDGDVTLLVPWLKELGIAGVLPLERQAGVDGLKLRQQFPDFLFIGHFDKMTMNRGEQAMRAEFERLLPMMRAGGFIPSVDHQTPPGVSLDQYRSLSAVVRRIHGRDGLNPDPTRRNRPPTSPAKQPDATSCPLPRANVTRLPPWPTQQWHAGNSYASELRPQQAQGQHRVGGTQMRVLFPPTVVGIGPGTIRRLQVDQAHRQLTLPVHF